jgi:predicted ester cyclase
LRRVTGGNAKDTAAGNKELVRRFIDALRTGDVATAASSFDAERYVSHAWGGDLATTWERMKAARRDAGGGRWESTTVALIADGDRVVHHSHVRAAHTGPLLGVPATGNEFEFHMIEIWRIENGKIVEHWGGMREAERLNEQLVGGER